MSQIYNFKSKHHSLFYLVAKTCASEDARYKNVKENSLLATTMNVFEPNPKHMFTMPPLPKWIYEYVLLTYSDLQKPLLWCCHSHSKNVITLTLDLIRDSAIRREVVPELVWATPAEPLDCFITKLRANIGMRRSHIVHKKYRTSAKAAPPLKTADVQPTNI